MRNPKNRSSASVPLTLLGLADAFAAGCGLTGRRLLAGDLLAAARHRFDGGDFAGEDLQPALDRLLDACFEEARLGLVGRAALRWDALRFLGNLLRMRAEERCDPTILGAAVARPIFITGLPRSGTTFLHRLMIEDYHNRAPRVFETIAPYPRAGKPDRRIAAVNRQLRGFERIAPEFRSLHPIDAESPQECSEINAHVFRSLRFDTTYQVPSYRSWLDGSGHLAGYRFHRRFLQHMQRSGAAERWVLKCPDHLFALNDLRAVYPDARLVLVHRDPVKVLVSVAQLTEVLRRPFTRKLDRERIGRDEVMRWHDGTLRMIRAADESAFVEPICHVHYRDLVNAPLATVEGVYAHFGLTLPAEAAARITRVVAARPNGGYGQHQYRFADHGLDPDAEHDRFRAYMTRFGIEAE